MSPRPQLAVGDYGNISYSVLGDGQHVAQARLRDADGETRRVKAQGRSKGAAAEALKAKFKERATAGELSSESRVAELAERYWVEKQGEDLAANTRSNLRRSLDNHIIRRVGKLRVREVTTQRLDRVIRDITKEHGPGTALTVRSAMSGMFGSAVRWGATKYNPVTHTGVPKLVRKQIRVLTVDELWVMRSYAVDRLRPLTFEERLARANGDKTRMGGKDRGRDPLDIMDFLLSTGCRAGEVPGLEWADVHLDDVAPWVEVRQQVVRVPGVGLELTQTKEHDVRRLRLPGFAVEMLTRRLETAAGPMVFPSERGGLKAPRNIATAWKNTFRDSDWEWVTQKTLRKTVATLVDAEHGSQLASRQLGHTSDKMTRRHYIAQSLVPVDTGTALDLFRV